MSDRAFERILVATDFSTASANAVEHAVAMAERAAAVLHIVHVVPSQLAGPLDAPDPWNNDAERSGARRLRDVLPRPGVTTVSALLQHTDIAPAIVDYTYDRDIDLVVVGSGATAGRPLLGSVAQQVARLCPVSVVIAGDGPTHRMQGPSYRTVLAAVDFSGASRQALRQAARLCQQHGAALVVLHVVDQPEADYGDTAEPMLRAQGRTTQHALAALEDLTTGLRVARLVVAEGRVHGKINDVARAERADLIVIGAAGLSALDRFLIGGIAERVVRSAPCPVLVARPRERVAI